MRRHSAPPNSFELTVDGQTIGYAMAVSADGVHGSGRGGQLLAHELTHLTQQSGGKKRQTIRLKSFKPAGSAPGYAANTLKIRGKIARLSSKAHAGLGGRVVSVNTSARAQEWTIVYETIQRLP